MSNRQMKAHEIVALFVQLLWIDLTTIANVVGNMPRANVAAWLSGKKENLRHESVIRLLDLVGLKVREGVYLDPSRVHVWKIKDGLLRNSRNAYEPLRILSRLMADSAITRIEPPKRGWLAKKRHQVYLISGPGVRVVVEVSKSIFKSARVTPEHVPGALWRDPVDPHSKALPHTIETTPEKWSLLVNRDLAPFEFDQIFNQEEPKLRWQDVAMLAREYSITPDMIHEHILSTQAQAEAPSRSKDEQRGEPLDVHPSVILLSHEARRRSAAA